MPVDATALSDWLAASIRLATPLVLTAMGGVYSERSGVLNIGMEGMMLTGAFVAVTVSFLTGSAAAGMAAGVAAGALLSLVHAYLTISRRADQILCGVALNLMALGLTNFLYRTIFGAIGRERVAGLSSVRIPMLSDLPVIGPALFDQSVAVYLAYFLPLLAVLVLFRTAWGLSVRAVGEHPRAADSAGVVVERVRYTCVLLSGAAAGLGGAALSLGAARYFTQNMTAGRGFIVLGALVFGKWHPIAVGLACLFFGAADALQLRAQTFEWGVPHQFLVMLPYVLTIAAMVGLIGSTLAPSQLGIPYQRERE